MRWVVGQNDGDTVGEVLSRAHADKVAVREGRVFVGRRRVRTDDERVQVGDVVEVAPRRPESDEPVQVLARTSDLLIVNKPAGIPTIPDQTGGAHSLVARAARAAGLDEAVLHPTSRLDRDVSGVVVLALDASSGKRLARARQDGRYERRYVALASAAPHEDRGTWEAAIGRARDPRLRAVGGLDPIPATTRYGVCARAPCGAALLAVSPITGRTHQIRVHAAHAGTPLLGDRAYGGSARLTLPGGRVVELRRIALHAARVVVLDEHGSELEATAPIPADLCGFWTALGGTGDAWETAVRCALD
jgi:RluA family pseudouridine synthase